MIVRFLSVVYDMLTLDLYYGRSTDIMTYWLFNTDWTNHHNKRPLTDSLKTLYHQVSFYILTHWTEYYQDQILTVARQYIDTINCQISAY